MAERVEEVQVVPAFTSSRRNYSPLNPDGIFLSNGPGDPEPVTYAADSVRKLLGKKPVFGICLGHQILGIALGGKTYKLKFGHRGANQPVKDVVYRERLTLLPKIMVFAVDSSSLDLKQGADNPY